MMLSEKRGELYDPLNVFVCITGLLKVTGNFKESLGRKYQQSF